VDYIEDYSTGRKAYPGLNWTWIQVGLKSSCIVVHGKPGHEKQNLFASLRFMINDPNLGDNAGGSIATVYQYW